MRTSAAGRRFDLVRRAFGEFMTLPSLVVAAFVGLVFVTLWFDSSHIRAIEAGRRFILQHAFRTESGTQDLLDTLLSGLLTLISITFSILLLAVQQTASSLSNQVFDQFLRRSTNQVFLGYAVGLALATLLVRAMVGEGFNPVYSAAVIVVLTIIGLALLILLIYGTIYQMRPIVIIEAMHDHTLAARERQKALLAATRRESACTAPVQVIVRTADGGFLQNVRLERLPPSLRTAHDAEIEIAAPIGAYFARSDRVATIRASDRKRAEALIPALQDAIRIESDRDLDSDPAWGIAELESMAWTTVSSAKSTPEPPRMVINALRDMFVRWSSEAGSDAATDAPQAWPVVLTENLRLRALGAIATIGAGANESLQHEVMVEALEALLSLFETAGPEMQPHVSDTARRLVPALEPLILTRNLEEALKRLLGTFERHDQSEVAAELTAALGKLRKRMHLADAGPPRHDGTPAL